MLCCTAKWFHYMFIFFSSILFHYGFITRYWIYFPVLCSRTLFIHSIYNSLYLLPPTPIPSLPPPPLFLGNHKAVPWAGTPTWLLLVGAHPQSLEAKSPSIVATAQNTSLPDISCWEMGLVDESPGSPIYVLGPVLAQMTKPSETWNGNVMSITKIVWKSCVLMDSSRQWRNTEVWMCQG